MHNTKFNALGSAGSTHIHIPLVLTPSLTLFDTAERSFSKNKVPVYQSIANKSPVNNGLKTVKGIKQN